MHVRTKAQAYTGNAQENWHWLKKLTENVNIPVIGNGDVKTPEDAKRMIDETGVTAVMMGRAALETLGFFIVPSIIYEQVNYCLNQQLREKWKLQNFTWHVSSN